MRRGTPSRARSADSIMSALSDPGGPDERIDDSGPEARAAFLLRLRERGIRDLAVLRAMEAVSRRGFVRPEHRALAERDLNLPIGCGQTVPDPLFVARLLSASLLAPSMRVLLIGAGCGFTTAALSHMASHVTAVERFRSLADEARTRLDRSAIRNADVVWGDGLAWTETERFDRVLLVGMMNEIPPGLMEAVGADGALLRAREARDSEQRNGQDLVRLRLRAGRPEGDVIICPSRLPLLLPGTVPPRS